MAVAERGVPLRLLASGKRVALFIVVRRAPGVQCLALPRPVYLRHGAKVSAHKAHECRVQTVFLRWKSVLQVLIL